MNLADTVSIDIPGVGQVEALNAAQESTLRAILAAIKDGGKDGGDSNDFLKIFARDTKVIEENTDELDESTKRSEERGKKAAQAFKAMSNATKGVVGALGGSGGAAEAIKGAGDAISKGLSGIPVFGAALGAGFGFLTAQVSATMENFASAQASGASFGNSMMTLRDVSAQAGITMGQMSVVAKQAGESLSMFGGGTAQGARDFAKFNGAVRNSGMDKQMVRMGLSFQDQAVAMADYTGQLATYGERVSSLDPQAVARGFFALTKQQKMLSQYNGITLEQQRQEMKAKRKDVALRSLTMGMDKDQQEAAEALASQLTKLGGPVAEQYMKEMIAHGGAVSAEAALFAQSFPELAKMANEGAAGLKAGTLETADTMRMVGQLDPVAMKAQAVAAGEVLKMTIGTGVSNPLTEMTSQTLVPALDTIAKAINETANKIQADNAALDKPTDSLTESYVSATQATQKLQLAMEKIATSVMASGGFNWALEKMIDGMSTAADALDGKDTTVDGVMGGAAAGAAAGAALGLIGGPLAPITSTLGAIAGALIGGVSGYNLDDSDVMPGWFESLSGIGSVFGFGKDDIDGKKAAGGPVNAGSKYEVNEIGQELFTPSSQGTISPHNAYKNLMSNMSDLVSDMTGMKTRLEKQQGLETKAPGGVADFAGVISGIMQAGNGLFDTLKTNITDNMSGITSALTGNNLFGTIAEDIMDDMSGITSALTGNNLFGTLATDIMDDMTGITSALTGNNLFGTIAEDIMDDMTGITSALTGNNLFGTIAEDITGMMSSLTSQSNIDQESMTQGTAEISNVYKNIMVDMAGMKAQLAEQQTDTIQPVLPATAEASMSQVSNTSSNPFSEDQEVRDALISLPGIMIQNMNHLRSVNDTLEVKLTELSRNVA